MTLSLARARPSGPDDDQPDFGPLHGVPSVPRGIASQGFPVAERGLRPCPAPDGLDAVDVQAWLGPPDGEAAFLAARSLSSGWISSHFGIRVDDPETVVAYRRFVDGPSTVQVIDIPAPRTWSCRIEHVDPVGVAWLLELTLAVVPGHRCCFRLTSSGTGPDGGPATPSHVPAVAAILAWNVGLHGVGGQAFGTTARFREGSAARLLSLVRSTARRSPVLAVCVEPDRDGYVGVLGGAREMDALAARLAGACSVVAVDLPVSREATLALGVTHGLYDGAVRLYRPGFQGTPRDAFEHPLFPSARVLGSRGGVAGFEDHVATLSIAASNDACFSSPLTSGFAGLESLLRMAHVIREPTRPARDEGPVLLRFPEGRSPAHPLVGRGPVARRATAPTRPKAAYLDDLREWADENLGADVAICERALKIARKTRSGRVQDVRAALVFLKDHFVPMMRAGGRRAEYLSLAAGLGFKAWQVTRSEASNAVDPRDYVVDMDGRSVDVLHKLSKGTCRDERLQLWVYFGWDAVGDRVVVGRLPTHVGSRTG